MSNRGFTLIEVLVAGFILFLAISTASVVFSSAAKSTDVASRSVTMDAPLPVIFEQIRYALLDLEGTGVKRSGEGELLNISYSWRAQVAEQAPMLADLSLEESRQNSNANRDVTLWNVNATVTSQGRSDTYQFYVTTWS